MPDSPHLFADRLVNIAVTGPLVRIELGVMQLPTAEGQKPQLLPTQTLVMPLEGFAQSFGMLEALIKRLVADGVIKPTERSAESVANAPGSAAPQ